MARVLVVDDSLDLLRLIEIQLKAEGHRVATAPSAADALALVDAKGAPDIAVLDVAMPEMSGLDLLKELRRKPGFEGMPALFLSAKVTPDDVAAGKAVGAGYLGKPYDGEKLVQAVQAGLNTLPSGRLIQNPATDKEVSRGW